MRVLNSGQVAVKIGYSAAKNLVNSLGLSVTEEDKNLLILDVWVSSFYHKFIGDIQLDNLMKGNLPFPCTGKEHEQTKDYAIQVTTIAATTMTRMYAVNQVHSLINQKDTISMDAWKQYSRATDNLKTGIDAMDAGKMYAAVDF